MSSMSSPAILSTIMLNVRRCRGLRLLETSILSMAIAVLQTYIGKSLPLMCSM